MAQDYLSTPGEGPSAPPGHRILVGLIGWPVGHSLSPRMHQAAARALGLALTYVAMPVRPADLATAVRGLPALGFRGVNVTIPHKQAVTPLLDEIAPAAAAIGAVNTIIFDEGRSRGENGDWSGFLADLRAQGTTPAGQHCLVLGAGGSARAVVYALGRAGGVVQVVARRPSQAEQLVADLVPHLPSAALRAGALADLAAISRATPPALIVNTTPLGMSPDNGRSPWPDELPLPAGAFVYDLVYNPPQTRLMQQAEAAGSRAANGLGMLVQQGAAAFAWWTGQTPDTALMAAAIQTG